MISSIWHKKDISVHDLSSFFEDRMLKHLCINIEVINNDSLVLSMPVTDSITQPFGLLHGGASCVLAESAGSIASNIVVDSNKYYALGLEINATHLNPAKPGDHLIAMCKPVKLGKTIHSWDIEVLDKKTESIISKTRLTTIIKKKKS